MTLAAPKVPLVLPPAEHVAGDVVIADIGIPLEVVDEVDGPRLHLLTRDSVRALVQPRARRRAQGRLRPRADRGRLARQDRRGGAGRAAARCAAAPGWSPSRRRRRCQPIVAALGVEFMTVALDDTGDGVCDLPAVDQVLALEADVVAIGPGLGTGPAVGAFVREVIARCEQPLVVDADALNACAGDAGRAARPRRPRR